MKRAAATALALMVYVGLMTPGTLRAQEPPAGPETVTFPAKRGTVTLNHAKHAQLSECVVCHHESRPEKPLTSANEKCSACHAATAAEPMKTTLRNAFHDVAKKTGTCYTCHIDEAAKGKPAPTTCDGCHVRAGSSPAPRH